MKLQMAHEDERGFTAEESIWLITEYEFKPLQKSMQAIITGYKSQANYDAGATLIGTKSYRIYDATVFDTYFAESVLAQAEVTVETQIFQYAMDTEDTEEESFFVNAVIV